MLSLSTPKIRDILIYNPNFPQVVHMFIQCYFSFSQSVLFAVHFKQSIRQTMMLIVVVLLVVVVLCTQVVWFAASSVVIGCCITKRNWLLHTCLVPSKLFPLSLKVILYSSCSTYVWLLSQKRRGFGAANSNSTNYT